MYSIVSLSLMQFTHFCCCFYLFLIIVLCLSKLFRNDLVLTKIQFLFAIWQQLPDPITNLTIDAPTWVNQNEDFTVNIACNGSAQFEYCIQYVHSAYAIVDNETCDTWTMLERCNYNSTLAYVNSNNESGFGLLVIVRNAVSIQRHMVYVRIRQSVILVATVVGIFVFALCLIMAFICCILQCCRKRKR